MKLASGSETTGIEADGDQSFDLAGMNGFDERNGRKAFLWNRFLRHAPDTGNVLAVLRICRCHGCPAAGRISALLAATLAVSLAGNHRVTAAFAPDPPSRHDQVDRRHAVLHAFGVVLNTSRMHQEAGGRGPP